MKARFAILAAAVVLPLAACQTTDDSQWVAAGQGVPFNRAEETCEDQQDFIADDEARPAFFVKCMVALGWTPKDGTRFARVVETRGPG